MKRTLLPAFLLITALSWGNAVRAEETKANESKPMPGGTCAMHCRMNMSSARKTKDKEVMKAMKDCMTKCSNPKTHKTASKDCADACKTCAESCESKHDKKLPHSQNCMMALAWSCQPFSPIFPARFVHFGDHAGVTFSPEIGPLQSRINDINYSLSEEQRDEENAFHRRTNGGSAA